MNEIYVLRRRRIIIMIKSRNFIVLMLLIIPLMAVACADNKKLDDIAESQKEIMDKINVIENKIDTMQQDQKEMIKLFKPRRQAVDYNKIHNLPVGSSAVKGRNDASVTIVEFSDFQCPYCARLQPVLNEVLNAYPDDVRLVFKDFPLQFHKMAKSAARAARAAGEQGKYWEMHDLIFGDFKNLSDDKFKEFAMKLNLDVTRFTADYRSAKYDELIQQDISLGRSAGVGGTPTLFVNGKRMQRRGLDDFKQVIQGYLKKK